VNREGDLVQHVGFLRPTFYGVAIRFSGAAPAFVDATSSKPSDEFART
jgi:hypothetical protein